MYGTVRFLWDDGYHGLAVLLTFFSILMPWLKLAGIVYVLWKPPATVVLKVVQRISKWAMMDIIVTMTTVAVLGDISFLGISLLEVTLCIGFYCFLVYCILSVAGVLLLEPQYETEQGNWSIWNVLIAIALGVVGLCILGVLFTQPILYCSWFPFIDMELTIFGIIQKLWTNGFYCPSIVMGAVVVVLPALDVCISSAQCCGLPVNQLMIQWIEDFQMLDVFSLGVVITALSLGGSDDELELMATPQLYMLLTISLLWLVFTLALHEWWSQGARCVYQIEDNEAYLGKAG